MICSRVREGVEIQPMICSRVSEGVEIWLMDCPWSRERAEMWTAMVLEGLVQQQQRQNEEGYHAVPIILNNIMPA